MKTSTEPTLVRHALSGSTMGTRYSAVFYAPPAVDLARIQRDLQRAVDLVDGQMSTYRPDSDLCRFNAAPVGRWVDVPEALLGVIETALDIGEASGGAFDIGVADAVDAWGFGPAGQSPDAERIAVLPPARQSAAQSLVLDRPTGRIRKTAPIRLDLSGIAKGFGVDELGRALDRNGVTSYLVSIDGEMRARGQKPDGSPWAVGIERPDPNARGASGVVELTDSAVATSGDYRHSVSWEGRSLSHTIDPATGSPVANRLASVTVLARESMQADAWATVLMVLGETGGPAFALRNGIDALFMLRTPDGISEFGTGRFGPAAA